MWVYGLDSPYNCLTSSFVLLLQYPATHIGPNIFYEMCQGGDAITGAFISSSGSITRFSVQNLQFLQHVQTRIVLLVWIRYLCQFR